MNSRDLIVAGEQASRTYAEACSTQSEILAILSDIPVNGTNENVLYQDVKPIAEQVIQATTLLFDVMNDLKALVENLQAVERVKKES